jgi:hypothetical protein
MKDAEYIDQRLDDQINWYDRKSVWNKRWFHVLAVIQIVTSALIPFLAVQIKESSFSLDLVVGSLNLDFVVGAMGVIVAVAAGIVTLYKFQEHWIEYRTTAETLQHEKFMYVTRSGPYVGEEAFPILVERVEAAISQEHTRWVDLAKAKRDAMPGKRSDT